MKLKVLELFSGIGGMHLALNNCKSFIDDLDFEVVAAVDINQVANQVYRVNFPHVTIWEANISGLKVEKLQKLGIDCIVMSPPCQPFSRQGHQKDLDDSRSEPLAHLVQNILPQLSTLRFLIMENVKGFEQSQARHRLTQALILSGFYLQEHLVCPTEVGMPNSRMRYYLVAKKGDHFHMDNWGQAAIRMKWKAEPATATLKHYLEHDLSEEEFLVPKKVMQKYGPILDMVQETSVRSCCFTKAYTRYAEGTGSVLILAPPDQQSEDESRARYFSPREICRLQGFPEYFRFPDDFRNNDRRSYKVLGNSLNVTVVTMMAVILFSKQKK